MASSGDLSQYTGFLLRRAFVVSVGCARACVGERTQLREIGILMALAQRGALSQRELSDLLHVNRSLVVKLVDALEAKGWVTRKRNQVDRRSYALELTGAGRAALQDADRQLEEAERRLTALLSDGERSALRRALLELVRSDDAGRVLVSERTGYLIVEAHRSMRARAEQLLEPLAIGPRDFGVLSVLSAAQPCSQQRLAAELGVSPPAAMAFVDELIEAGLVERTRNPGDRRAYEVTLTPLGRERLGKARRLAGKAQAEVTRLLGEAAEAQLRTLLLRIIEGPLPSGTATATEPASVHGSA
jgi:DNA-binding MarR family transcriptional regulator